MKPTKLRNGNDDLRKPRLLDLNQNELWFNDLGEAIEEDHIVLAGSSDRRSADGKIDFEVIFETDVELSRKDIVERCNRYGYGSRTIDRSLATAIEDGGVLEKSGHGKYKLKSSPSTTDTPATN